MATATARKSGKSAAKQAAASGSSIGGIEIPAAIKAPAAHGARILKIADVVIGKDKQDRVRDAAFEESVRELAANIARNGLLNPITVQPLKSGLLPSGELAPEGRIGLVAGERRLRACMLLGWTEIPAIVLHGDVDGLDARAAENLQRQDLDEDSKAFTVGGMLEREIEAIAVEQGVKFESLDAPGQDALRTAAVKRVAARLGWPALRVSDYAFAAELPEDVLALARQGRLTLAHLKLLAQLPDADAMRVFAMSHAAGEDPLRQPAKSVDDLKRDIAREIARLNKVPWDLDAVFGPEHKDGRRYACSKCPHNSANRTGLFDGLVRPEHTSHFDVNGNHRVTDLDLNGGICTKMTCYRAKLAATKQAWRGAADRIAKKAAEAKPAERTKLIATLVKEASERCDFVPVTVFGRLAKERIQQKLEDGTPAKQAKAQAETAQKRESQEARYKAEYQLRQAEREMETRIEDRVRDALAKLPRWRGLLFDTLLATRLGGSMFDYGRSKPEEKKKFKAAAETVLRGESAEAALKAIESVLTSKDRFLENLDGNLDDYQVLVDLFAITDLPPRPTIQDFLPKSGEARGEGPSGSRQRQAVEEREGQAEGQVG